MPSPKSKKPSPRKAAAPEEPKSGETPAEPSGEEAEVERLREEVQQLQDNLARVQAELANSQKRYERDRAAAARYRVEPLARELLDILDVMEEAREAMAREENVPEAVREGQGLILRHMTQVLERFSIEAIDPGGKDFDPQLHEAMATRPTAEAPPGCVIEVFRKGYRLHDRLLRPAKVVVATEPASEEPGEEGEGDESGISGESSGQA